MSESPDYDPSQSPRGEGTAPWGKSPLGTREQILAQAVQRWLDVDIQTALLTDAEAINNAYDEADIALEKVLVDQGVMKAGEGGYFEPGAREHQLVHIFLGDRIIQIDTDGKIEEF